MVADEVIPPDAQNISQAIPMVCVEAVRDRDGEGPGFTSIQQNREHAGVEDADFS